MKKMFLAFYVLGGAILFEAQGQNRFQNGEYDVLVLMDSEVLRIRDNNQIRLVEPIILRDGTVVNPDGFYHNQVHKRSQLQNGECLDNDGVKYYNEYQYRHKIEQENKGLDSSQVRERNENRYHVMLIKDEVHKIINHEQYKIQNPVDLGYGKFINPNGVHRTSYGYSRLKEGGCITIVGRPLINLYEHRKAVARKEARALKKLHKNEEVKTLGLNLTL